MSPADKTSTARPTREEIRGARECAAAGYLLNRKVTTLKEWEKHTAALDRIMGVLDYALDCLIAEQEAETVPDEGAEVGTPVWREEGDGNWRACVGKPETGKRVLRASETRWARYPDRGWRVEVNCGGTGSLVGNVRAASASWNAAHPGLPPVVVPERFREVEAVPQVEPPEDAKPAEPAPESDADFLARHGVGEWKDSMYDDASMQRKWDLGWLAVAPNGSMFPRDSTGPSFEAMGGDTTTPEGRAALDARLVAHLRAEGRT